MVSGALTFMSKESSSIFKSEYLSFVMSFNMDFEFFSIEVALGGGKREVVQYNDLLFLPSKLIKNLHPKEWEDVKRLAKWIENIEENDYFRWELFR